jgi:hypothetical protein
MLLHKGRCHPGGETEEHRLREIFEDTVRDTVRVETHDEIDLSHNFFWERRIHVGGAFELLQKRRFPGMREDVTDPVEPEDVEAIPVGNVGRIPIRHVLEHVEFHFSVQLLNQFILAIKVVIDDARAHTGDLSDLRNRGVMKAPLSNQTEGGIEDGTTLIAWPVVLWHAATPKPNEHSVYHTRNRASPAFGAGSASGPRHAYVPIWATSYWRQVSGVVWGVGWFPELPGVRLGFREIVGI